MSKSNNHKLFFLMILTFLYFATEWKVDGRRGLSGGFPIYIQYSILSSAKSEKISTFFLKNF